MNKKGLILTIALFVVVAIIGVGWKVYVDKKEEAEKMKTERMSVEALKSTFADIKAIEFEKSNYDAMTGTYSMFVKMTNKEGKSVRFTYNYEKNKPKETRGYILEDEEVQMEGETKDKVQVIFSNKEKEEI